MIIYALMVFVKRLVCVFECLNLYNCMKLLTSGTKEDVN